jgi:hypothetical protein
MASKRSKDNSGGKVVWQGFVNVYLTKQEKEVIRAHPLDYAAALQFIADAATSGYKFSGSYAEEGGFYTATLYGNRAGTPNAGWAMSLRHSDFLTALSALHYVLAEDGWNSDWSERFTTASDNDW